MGLAYGGLFEKWEVGLANAIVREFRSSYKILEKEDEDDLVQECLIQWLSAKSKYKAKDNATLKTFMRRVVKNKLANIVEKISAEKRKASYEAIPFDETIETAEESDSLKTEDDPTRSIHESDLESSIQETLKKLTPKQQELCRLLYEEGLSINEASKRFKESRAGIYREVIRIRELFEKEGLKDYL